MSNETTKPNILQSLVPIIFLIGLLAVNVYIFEGDSSYGPNQIALILAAAVAAIVGIKLGFRYKELLEGVVSSISAAMGAILILLVIGSLAGTWMISGIVPAMIYYGLEILSPKIFLFAACAISAVVSIATGSSWTTAATIGVAMVGIGQALGLGEGIIAGAIISGAYFGDKMSPLSDTTNLAPAMAGTELFTHIRYMLYTTGPSILISLAIFLIWGFTADASSPVGDVSVVQDAITSKFNINLWLFLVPVAVIFMIVKKMPAIPALLIGSLLGGIFAIFFQPDIVMQIAEINKFTPESMFKGVMKAIYTDTAIVTGNESVDKLLQAGGMEGMLNTIWLIISAMIFGGVMEKTGMLKTLAEAIIRWANSTGSLVLSTASTCVVFNLVASDQYIAIVVPGRMYSKVYKERGLAPENLSRTLEDAGTVTSVLIPWNTCGAFQSKVLGVQTIDYLPYCFFNIISPFMTVIFAYANIKIRRLTAKETA